MPGNRPKALKSLRYWISVLSVENGGSSAGSRGKLPALLLLTPAIGVWIIIPDTDVIRTWMSGIMQDEVQKRGNPGLKQLRERAKLNRQKMAAATGVHVRMWQRYENEGRLPESVDVLIRIAVLAGTSLDEAAQTIGYSIPSREDLIAQIENAQTDQA